MDPYNYNSDIDYYANVNCCYFILFYFILFYFILFYFILFYFILFYFILFYFILFYFILFYFILFYFILLWTKFLQIHGSVLAIDINLIKALFSSKVHLCFFHW